MKVSTCIVGLNRRPANVHSLDNQGICGFMLGALLVTVDILHHWRLLKLTN